MEQGAYRQMPYEEITQKKYEMMVDEDTFKLVFLENRKTEAYKNGENPLEENRKISGTEVHIGEGNPKVVYKIESNGDLTFIATIADGKRKEESGETSYKKIK